MKPRDWAIGLVAIVLEWTVKLAVLWLMVAVLAGLIGCAPAPRRELSWRVTCLRDGKWLQALPNTRVSEGVSAWYVLQPGGVTNVVMVNANECYIFRIEAHN